MNKRRVAGVLALGLLAFLGCAAELDKNRDYEWAFADGQGQGGSGNAQGGSGTAQGGSGTAQGGTTSMGGMPNIPMDPDCLKSLATAKCNTCHASSVAATIGANLDLSSPNIGQRLRNKASNCSANPPLINTSDLNNSTFLKKVTNAPTGCNGSAMPPGSTGLQGGELDCVKNWVMSF
ncbi:MAG: hypothetical protein ACOY0T_40805 [Myxococcota bacterium]